MTLCEARIKDEFNKMRNLLSESDKVAEQVRKSTRDKLFQIDKDIANAVKEIDILGSK